jgi:hypothetical protein
MRSRFDKFVRTRHAADPHKRHRLSQLEGYVSHRSLT